MFLRFVKLSHSRVFGRKDDIVATQGNACSLFFMPTLLGLPHVGYMPPMRKPMPILASGAQSE